MFKKCFFTLLTNRNHFLVLLLLMSFSQLIQAQVYRCETDSGNIVFSDEPCARGDTSTRLDWLKTTPSSKSKKQGTKRAQQQAKKTAQKAKKHDESYVLLSLLTTTQLELETASLRSKLEDEKTELPELILPDGIIVDLLMVEKMEMTYRLGKNDMRVRFVMMDGYEEVKTIKKPFPVLMGSAKIGRFSKSLEDIKRIEFFNSEKLRKKRGDKVIKVKKRKKTVAKESPSVKKEEVPVIELDLSDEGIKQNMVKKKSFAPITNYDLNTAKVNSNKIPETVLPVSKLKSKSKVEVKTEQKPTNNNLVAKPKPDSKYVSVIFTNDKRASVLRSSFESSRRDKPAKSRHFILSDTEQIPFEKIRTIRIMPTADQSKLVVAVALKTGETKMENMLPPFTKIEALTDSGAFSYSLLEIRSISFQR